MASEYPLQGPLDAARKVDQGLASLEKGIIVLSLLVMVGGIFLESLSRWMFDKGIPGVSEISRFLMVYVGFMGASVATSEKKHIVVDVLAKVLADKPRAAAALGGIASLLSAAVMGFMVYACWTYLESRGVQTRVSPALSMPLKYAVVIMPLATALMVVRFLQVGLEELAISAGLVPADYGRVAGGFDDLLEDAGVDAGLEQNGDEEGAA